MKPHPPKLLILLALGVTLRTSSATADEATSCGDAFEQSQVLRDDGRLLEARRLLRACSRPECSATQRRFCAEWLTDVDARTPSVVLGAKDGAGKDLVDVRVSIDGKPLASKLDGRSLDVNPGPHTFVFELEGGARAETRVVVKERSKGEFVSVAFPAPAGPATSVTAAPPPPVEPARRASPLFSAGIVVGAVGVGGIALGSGFGLLALSTKSSDCTNGVCKSGDSSKAYTQGAVSTAGFVAGGVLLAGGVTLVVLSRKTSSDRRAETVSLSPWLTSAAQGLQVGGTW